jgi:hypothetical protein
VPAIIRNIPFFDRPTTVQVRGRSVRVKPDQIVVWVSVSEMGLRQLHPDTPRLPAILDTGSNHNFVIRRSQLLEWAGIHPEYVGSLGPTRLHGRRLPQLAANVWLHPNRPRVRDEFAEDAPFLLECQGGIVVIPEKHDQAELRLPVMGLRAVRRNNLRLSIDGRRRLVSIRTSRRFWLVA